VTLSGPFIRRPIATTLLAAALFLAGALAFTQLPVSPLPRVDFPTIQISANLPGASPETMASSVATPLERRFGRIAGVTEITSTSSLGSTSITLQFALDRDVDSAARDVQASIAAAGGELPPNLPFRPTYRKVNPADSPIMIVSLTSDTVPLAQVYDQANTVLAQKIAQVPGVGQVFVGGGQQPAVRVQVDPVAISGVGLGLEDVRTAIATATIDQPKGSLTGPSQSHVIAANDQLFGAAAFKGIILPAKEGTLRLGDVAEVFDDVENQRVAAWTNGVRSVTVIIRRQPGANIIEVNERVRALLPRLASSISPAIKLDIALDRTQTIRASVHDVERTLVIAIGLVVLVVFAFLRSARATAIPSIAVPLSLVGTFGAMYLLGYSVDNLSLMALTISTGFVVDDAIVVTENITRHIELGMPPRKAALEGAKEIGFTIVSMTTSLLAVFIPILLMGGIVGRLFREFAVTMSVAIAVSAVVSLTLTPMMCSRLLRHDAKHGRLYHASERAFQALVRGYDRALSWVLRHTLVMQLVTLATVAITVVLFIVTPKGLFPQQDNGLLIGFSEAPQDVSFRTMRERQTRVNAVMDHDPAIGHIVSFIGSGPGGGAVNTGSVFVELKERPPRKESADQVIARLRPKLGQVEGIALFMQAAQDVRVGGRASRTQYQYTLQDANLEELRTWAPRVFAALKKVPELKDVATDQQTAGLELDIDVDRDSASRMGITPQLIDDTLNDSFGQRQIATTYTQLNQYRVVMEVKPSFQQTPDALDSVYVKPPASGPVPLSAIAKVRTSSTPLSVNHQGQFPSITLSFNLTEGKSLGEAITAIHKAERAIGMPSSVLATFSGTAQAFQDSLASQPMLIITALIAVYVVLGMLYESYVHPITILSTLPSAGLGALLALLLFKTELSVIALIGMILLIGIVKKNAILMIDFAIEAQRAGKSPREAIHEACLLRFRPIMMTTAAALLGGLPLAVGTGMGSELRRPLGIAIVGGLIVSQALTLFTTPVIYLALDRLRRPGSAAERLHAPPVPA
jgi:hydrophobe/amphiphile efflux-1 (HAE1) family protein